MRATLLVATIVGLALTPFSLANLNWLAENLPIFGIFLVPGVLVEPSFGGANTTAGSVAFYVVQVVYYVVLAAILRVVTRKAVNRLRTKNAS